MDLFLKVADGRYSLRVPPYKHDDPREEGKDPPITGVPFQGGLKGTHSRVLRRAEFVAWEKRVLTIPAKRNH